MLNVGSFFMKTKSKVIPIISVLIIASALVFGFQNCAGPQIVFSESQLGKLGVCQGISCDLTPVTLEPAVTTILLALGDEDEDELVIGGISTQLIAETVVRYSSPVINPRILFVRDAQAGNESLSDSTYVSDVLLSRYDVTAFVETERSLQLSDTAGFDLIWFNNPGTPMGSYQTYKTLLNFKGGVIIQGDDLSRGRNFAMNELTGLMHVNNGTKVECNSQAYSIDNNMGNTYRVKLSGQKFVGAATESLSFQYGNDIDHTTVGRSDLEVLASAKGSSTDCIQEYPAIVRYPKPKTL